MAVNNYRFGESVGYVLGEYKCDFIGSTLVNSASGNDTTAAAVAKIKAAKKPTKASLLVISPKGIAMLDAKSKKIDKVTPIADVTFVAMDEKNQKIFSFISNNKTLNIMTCYNFKCSENSSAVVVDINDAFAISSGKQPHPPKEGPRRRMSQQEAADLSRKQSVKKSSMVRKGSRKSGSSGGSDDGAGKVLGTFEAKYVASVPVAERKGEKVVLDAIDDAFEEASSGGIQSFIQVTPEGVKCIDAVSQNVAWNIFLKEVSFTTVVNNLFAFINENETTGRMTCHVFACDEAMALEVCKAIGEAFKAAHEISKKVLNPFAVKKGDAKRERSPPLLAKVQVHRQDLVAIKAIGAGQFGQVWLATMKTSVDGGTLPVAIKLMRSGCSAADKEEFVRECEMTVSLSHDNLVSMLGVAIQQKPWLCVLEFLQYGDVKGVLEGIVEKGQTITEYERLNFCHQICAGMEHMAAKKMIHMDLALRNVLIKSESRVKVSDFGLTQKLVNDDGTFTLTGQMKLPLKWMAIEAMDRRVFSEQSDVWAFGVVVWEIYTYGAMPYEGVKNLDLQVQVRGPDNPLRLEQPSIMSDQIYDILTRAWSHRRTDRPPFEVVLSDLKSIMAREDDKKVRDLGKFMKESKKPVAIVKRAPTKRNLAARENFFAGDMPAAEAEALVMKGIKGAFLVRKTSPGNFAICFNDCGKVTNFPVNSAPDGKGMIFADKTFRSMETIVNLLKASPFKGSQGPMTLSKSVIGGVAKAPAPGSPQKPAGAGDPPKKSGPPAWYFGKTVPIAVCASSIRAGGNGDFLVRVDPDGNTAYIMVNDQGDIAEFPIDLKGGKFVFAKRDHKSLDEIVANLTTNAVPAKSGRKVKLGKPATPVKEGGAAPKKAQATPVPAPAKPATAPPKAKAGPPAWYFGKSTPVEDCNFSVTSGKQGDFCVRVSQDGKTAFIMVNDAGEVAEFPVTMDGFIFAKRPHKSLDEIVDNLHKNAVPAKSGRKVKLVQPATPKKASKTDKAKAANASANETLSRAKAKALDRSYFVGYGDEKKADKLISNAANGSYLVMQTGDKEFSLYVTENKKASKSKIDVNKKGAFSLGPCKGKDLHSLLEATKRESVVSSISGKPLTLGTICPDAASCMPSKLQRKASTKSQYGFGDDGEEEEFGFN